MNKKNEKKILEELRKRVIEKDRQLQERKEKSNLVNSNKEALAEMTDLSRAEVDRIEKQIRAELQAKVKKANKRKTWIIIAAVVIGFIAFRIILQEINKEPPVPPFHFVETFDNNSNNWDIYNQFELKRNIKDGAYSFVANRADWCHWDDLELNLPQSYSVKLSLKWKRGKFDEYGLMLMEDSENYFTFVLRADGNASQAIYRNKEWTKRNSWKPIGFKSGDIVTQRVDVTGYSYKYYINGKMFSEGSFKSMSVKKIAMRVCDKQSVDFLNIEVLDLKTGTIILSDDFKESSPRWDEKQNLTKVSKIEHGKFLFATNEEDQCYWAVSNPKISLPVAGSNKYTVKAKMTWLKGEESNFGIMLMADNNNYTAFQVRSSGDARAVRCESDEYTLIPDYISSNFVSDGESSIYMMIKVDNYNYEYFINNKLISSGDFNYMNITHLAMRVCGRQNIAFEELEIIEEP